MRIACVNQDPGIGPAAHKGAAVHVAAMRAAFAALGAEVVPCDQKQPEALRAALDAARERAPLDLVYERYALGCTEAARFAARHAVSHVLEVNAPLLQEARAYRGLRDDGHLAQLEADVFRGARAVLAVSREVAAGVLSHGVDASRVLVRPNAVDGALFRPRPRAEAAAGLPVRDESFVVGFHGRLRPWHGLPLLGSAFARLLERGVDATLLLVGEGEWKAALGGAVPDDRVVTVGWLPHAEVARVVARFDALALSYAPGEPCWFSPLKLLEAMACGAVPVVPALGDLADVVHNGRDGLVYPAGDCQQLAGALELLAREPSRRFALAAAAVETARGRSWTAVAREVMELAAPERSP